MNNRRGDKSPSWLGWVGDMNTITDYLITRPWASVWCVPKAINSILRAVGIVAFANNPITGFLIMAGMFVGNVNVFWACLLAGVLGVAFSKVLNQPENLISDGVVVFNGILVGCISVAVFPALSGHQIDSLFWLYVTFAVIVTSYVDKGLNALMAASKLPALSIPFNFSAAIMLLSMRTAANLEGTQLPEGEGANLTAEVNATHEIEWGKVFEGTLLASGQIYGVGTVDSSILVWLGFFFFSPLLTVFFYMGSVIGTMIGVLVSTAPYTDVYLGLWGYNAMLSAGGLSYFLVPLPGVFVAAIIVASLAGAVQAATVHIFSATAVPVLSYPFNVATLLFLAISTTENPPFVWVASKTFPEQHLVKYFSEERRLQNERSLPETEEPLQTVTVGK
ncbi:urea transporter 2-like isoform X1 [Penaeus monodon]|uniref:urea transporter 2-like isoform X1 n=1 Tax=Penaeus monodon TaxID=6687 RepID=UPI0018A7873D|nr:urea transporter 2-like isoform X1 [Penaeus monodon]